ncbi:hypothetical protein LF845_08240 [Deferribacterales bacterium Es71-Z0220]|uniref:hypothetical protein n=1 Tax=Deferrivibrio essentukiensis TaxID=2880922 RepID=UPI001F600F10|nr:hypothetical protein [Deferrivibrio essentukiensis]MCB4204947.1 hypothetical protein [Deferrivibrio essentukiensis]
MKLRFSLAFTFLLLSSLLTAAHFLRGGEYIFVTIFVILPFLYFFKHNITYYIIQFFLLFATVEWVKTAYLVIKYRIAYSIPYFRFSVILFAVICLVVYSMFLIRRSKRVNNK